MLPEYDLIFAVVSSNKNILLFVLQINVAGAYVFFNFISGIKFIAKDRSEYLV